VHGRKATFARGATVNQALVLKTESARLQVGGIRSVVLRPGEGREGGRGRGVAFFQVSIALGAVAALSRNRLVCFASLAVGAGGLFSFVRAFLG
jgi:hypothetical protein